MAEGDERIAKELPHPIEIVQKAPTDNMDPALSAIRVTLDAWTARSLRRSGVYLRTLRIARDGGDMTLTRHTKLSYGVARLWQMTRQSRPLSESDMIKLTPQEVHDHGLCNKARLHYECHGRDNYRECC